ncbi:MAG: class I SAM-dependent methyltransferase [Candidatus Magasanikbacteria bacterium]
MIEKSRQVICWGASERGEEEKGINDFWDARPIFDQDEVTWKDKVKLLFFPKKLLLYNWIRKALQEKRKENKRTGKFSKLKILDVACGTGANIIEMKKLWCKEIEVYGVDRIHLQVDLANRRIKEYGVWADISFYEANSLPFNHDFFDVVFSSDILVNIEDFSSYLEELQRVLSFGGSLVIFADSKLGKHAYIKNYLHKKGLDISNHKPFHLSSYSKEDLIKTLTVNDFEIKKMYTTFFLDFLTYPEDFYESLQSQNKFFFLRNINKFLCWLKIKTKPVSSFCSGLYSLIEMLTIGRFLQVQGYIVLAKKKHYNE